MMMGRMLVLAGGLLLAGPAIAQDATSEQGRYQIAPDGDGFVRLDTETGALAHCDRSDGVWRCEIVIEDRSEIDNRIVALQEEMAAMRAEMAELGERLAAIEESLDAAARESPESEGGLSEKREQEFDEALSFAERMMRHFLDMIRELKSEPPAQQI